MCGGGGGGGGENRGWGEWEDRVIIDFFFTKYPNLIFFFFWGGRWGARICDFFTKDPNVNKKKFKGGRGGGGGGGGGGTCVNKLF